jgi:hypothetical protein
VEEYGYEELPPDAEGVKRFRTYHLLRLWEIPRDKIYILEQDLGQSRFPGMYVLFRVEKQQVYIGESDDLRRRLFDHDGNPPRELREWDFALIISDARPFALSDLSESAIRRQLEYALIEQFRNVGQLAPVNRQVSEPEASIWTQPRFNQLRRELVYVLQRRGLLPKTTITAVREDFVPLPIFKEMLIQRGYNVEEWGAYEAKINGLRCFIRDGSQKPRGWQITLRNDFRRATQTEDGYILVNRGPGLIIPFHKLREFFSREFSRKDVFKQNTIDIFIKFHLDESVTLHYKDRQMDISDTKLS